MRTLNIKNAYCVTLNNKLDGYVRPPQIIVRLLQQKDLQLCNNYKSFFGHNSCNNNFDKQLGYFHNNSLVHITIWKCKNKCVLLILFNFTECAQEVFITDTTPFVLVNRRKSTSLGFSLTFLYIDTRMFLPFNCRYNPNIDF